MGLDITVHTKATPVDPAVLPRDEEGEIDHDKCWDNGCYTMAFVYEGFEQSYAGLPEGSYADKSDSRFFGNVWMDTSDGNSWGFRAGSYGGYNRFREALSQAALGVDPRTVWADPDAYRDKPFFELIHFADNEGTIGPVAAAELAKDFEEMRAVVVPFLQGLDPTYPDYYVEKYDEWANACRDAADTGLIQFH